MALDLTTARDRVRFVLGDVDDTNVLMQGGGLAVYTALLTLYSNDEVQTAQAAAANLAATYAAKPSSLSVSGKSLAWAQRVDQWRKIASGAIPYPFGADGSGSPSGTFSVGGQRDDGYTAAASEYTTGDAV